MFTLAYLINEACGVIHQNLLKKKQPEEDNAVSVEELEEQKQQENEGSAVRLQKEKEYETIMRELHDTYNKLEGAVKKRPAEVQQKEQPEEENHPSVKEQKQQQENEVNLQMEKEYEATMLEVKDLNIKLQRAIKERDAVLQEVRALENALKQSQEDQTDLQLQNQHLVERFNEEHMWRNLIVAVLDSVTVNNPQLRRDLKWLQE